MQNSNRRMSSEDVATSALIQRSSSLATSVYDAIFGQLMSLKIAPGSRIPVDNLVRQLSVSQTPYPRGAWSARRRRGWWSRPT